MGLSCVEIKEDFNMNDKENKSFEYYIIDPQQNLTITLNEGKEGAYYDFLVKETLHDVVITDTKTKKLLPSKSNSRFLYCDGGWIGYVLSINFL